MISTETVAPGMAIRSIIRKSHLVVTKGTKLRTPLNVDLTLNASKGKRLKSLVLMGRTTLRSTVHVCRPLQEDAQIQLEL